MLFSLHQPTWTESESGVQVVAINTRTLSPGASTARIYFVAHSSLMTDDLKLFIGCKGHPVTAKVHQSERFQDEAEVKG